MQCQSNSLNPMPMQCQSNSLDSWDPVSIVQDSSQVWLLGRFPIYRETTEEPDLRWTNPIPMQFQSNSLNPMPMQCQSNSFDSWDPVSIVQDSSQVRLLGCFPIYRETTEEPHLRWILYYWDRVPWIQWIWLTFRWQISDTPLVFNWHSIGIQLAFHWNSVGIPLVVDWHSIGSQLKYHW